MKRVLVNSTRFSPDTYEANGERNWGGNSDGNGTFARYANDDFAKRGDGRLVGLEMGFFFFTSPCRCISDILIAARGDAYRSPVRSTNKQAR
ncbi:MAG: hypothetical protein OHK0011_06090 [Turneriella sp.]